MLIEVKNLLAMAFSPRKKVRPDVTFSASAQKNFGWAVQ
jgi:hypothetical protein